MPDAELEAALQQGSLSAYSVARCPSKVAGMGTTLYASHEAWPTGTWPHPNVHMLLTPEGQSIPPSGQVMVAHSFPTFGGVFLQHGHLLGYQRVSIHSNFLTVLLSHLTPFLKLASMLTHMTPRVSWVSCRCEAANLLAGRWGGTLPSRDTTIILTVTKCNTGIYFIQKWARTYAFCPGTWIFILVYDKVQGSPDPPITLGPVNSLREWSLKNRNRAASSSIPFQAQEV